MTALLALERRKLVRRDHDRRAYRGAPAESVAGLRAGERMTVRRPAARAAAGQRQRRGGDARRRRRRLARGVRAADERSARASAGLTRHALREPDRARRAGQLLDGRATSRSSRCSCARNAFVAPDDEPAAARCCTAASHARYVVNRNTLIGAVPWINGVKTGHTSPRRLRARRLGAPRRRRRSSASCSATPSEARAQRRHAGAADATASRATTARHRASTTRRPLGRGRAFRARRRRRRRASSPARTVRVVVRRGERARRRRRRGLPDELEGPLPRGRARRRRSSSAPRARRRPRAARHRARAVAAGRPVDSARVAHAPAGRRLLLLGGSASSEPLA